jgi:6-phosphogluconolactonase (cycloisomerase 2 family)
MLPLLLLTGCGSFFGKVTTTTTTTTTSTTDYLYVANNNTSLDTVAGFSLTSGALTATASSPYLLGAAPSTFAITPSNSILYVGTGLGGIFAYLVGSGGGLTLVGSAAVASAVPAAMAVDSTGQWLLVMQVGLTNPTISAFPIDTSTGTLSQAVSTVTLDAGTAESMVQVPNSNLIYASLGTSGVDAVTFDSSTGALAKLNFILNPKGSAYADVGVATNPAGTFLFVAETGTNGVRSFTINTSTGIPTEVTGSPVAAGSGVGAVLVDRTGAFLYAANKFDNTISAYTITASGALTAITGSPFTTGTTPLGLAEDTTKGYLAVACLGGSPDLQLFQISATTGALTSALTQSTGSVSPAGAYAVVASY